ncbi:hypothetical protein D3H35_12285 [Cohnella faecalis]|uniref:SLH domain-containing protein n=1 Tax=Cohnella faecalis TaxID=2315694 RepID=A0A398CJD6_9BACL|nr:hypothetical protein D3H35_12285 [Cohnella faecalis]
MGYVQLDVPRMTLEAPDRVASNVVKVVGLAPAGSGVRIYDDNVLIGTAEASAAGTWQGTVTLDSAAGSDDHLLWAQSVSGAKTLQSEHKLVHYEQSQPILTEVAMAQYPNGKWLRLNVENGIAQLPYTVVPGNPFAFNLKFSDPDKVKNVTVYLGGQIGGPVTAERGADGLFRATVPTTRGALGGLYVDYDTVKPKVVVSREIPTDEETRQSLPAKLRDFELVEKTPFTLKDNVYSGSAVFDFPQVPNMRLVAKQTIDLTPNSYRPTVEEIVKAEATGVLMYNVSFEAKETADGFVVKMKGYVPKTVLIPASVSGSGFDKEDVAGKSKGEVKSLASFDEVDPLEILDDMGIDPSPYKQGMIQVSTDYAMIAKEASGPLFDIKEQYKGYREYAGKINKIMSNVEAATVCPENMEMTGEQAGKALLVTVGGEIAKTAIGAWTGAMMLEGPVGFIGGYAGKYVSNKIDSYVDEQIDKITTAGPTPTENCMDDSYDDLDEENIYKKRLKRIARMKWIYDPSGYVYEAVEGNRLEGVKATVLYKDSASGKWAVWSDARDYDQINPQFTDKEGRYGWDVPEGTWKVVWEKAGYEPAGSAELTVPPPHFDVNAGLVSKASPTVADVKAYAGEGGSYIDIEFSKYLRTTTAIPATEITVTGPDGAVVEGTSAYVEKQKNPGRDQEWSRKIRFTPGATVLQAGDAYEIKVVPETIVSYAGSVMLDTVAKSAIAVEQDTRGPLPEKAEAASGNTVIKVYYDEPIDGDVLLSPESFELTGLNGEGIGINSAILSAVVERPEGNEQPTAVILTLSRPLSDGAGLKLNSKEGAVSDALSNPSQAKSVELAGPNASLSGLTIAGGTMTEPFASDKFSYTVKVAASATRLQLKATLAEAGGKLSISGVPLASGVERSVEIPTDGKIVILAQAANHPDIAKSYSLIVQRNGSDPDPGPGPGPGTGSGTGTESPTGDKGDIGHNAKVISKTESDGRTGVVIDIKAETVRDALKSAVSGDEMFVKVPENADSYDVRVPIDAFRELAQSQLKVNLQAGNQTVLVQPSAWTTNVTDRMSAVHFIIRRASVQEERSWLDGLKARFGSLIPQSGLYKFAVEAEAEGGVVVLPLAVPNAVFVKWELAKEPPARQGTTGLYRYNASEKQWTHVIGAADSQSRNIEFALRDSNYLSVMTYVSEFADIANHWAKAQIDWMAARMLVSGYSEETFKPDRKVTRAEFAAMLARVLGLKPPVEGGPSFADVKPGDWYYDAVRAAAAARLIAGDGNGRFEPTELVTREQMTAMTWRAYKQITGESGAAPGEEEQRRLLEPYQDRNAIHDWARSDVAAAIQSGLAQGVSGSRFNPGGVATRGQAVTILKRIAEKLENKM